MERGQYRHSEYSHSECSYSKYRNLLLGGMEQLLQLAHLRALRLHTLKTVCSVRALYDVLALCLLLLLRLRHRLDGLLVLVARRSIVRLHRALEAQPPPV